MVNVKRKRKEWRLLFMALPFLVPVVLFAYIPLFGWSLAFINYRLGVPILQSEFVGLRFFRMFLTDRVDMFRVMRNTFIFAGIGYLVSPLPMIFAILINELRSVRYRKVVQTITTVPHFISWIIVFSLAFMIFANEGVLNSFLTSLGFQPRQSVLGRNDAVFWFQTAMGQWKGLGWAAIIYLAAIAGIDSELYEAAGIDGAGRWRCIRHITIPHMMPTYLVLMLLGIGSFLGVGFEQYFVFNNPMVARNIEVLDIFIYRRGLMGQDFSYATAIGVMRSVITIILLFIANAIAKVVRGSSII